MSDDSINNMNSGIGSNGNQNNFVPDNTLNPNMNAGFDPNAGMGIDPNMNMGYDPNAGMGMDPNMNMGYDPNAGMGMDPNMNMGYDPNAGMGMDPNMNMGYDPNAGMGMDPNMNAGFDPNAGMAMDPNMNAGYDPNAGMAMDPNMNAGYDPNAGMAMDPNMNAVFDPNAGMAMDPNMNMGYDPNAGMGMDPNMNAGYDPNAGMGMDPNMNMGYDPNAGMGMDPNMNMGYDPNAGIGMDPNMNVGYDPNAGMGMDPNMNVGYDPNSSNMNFDTVDNSPNISFDINDPIDSNNNMNPNMNVGYDPNAGMGMDPNMNAGYNPNAGMGMDPNMNAGYDPNAGIGMDPNMNAGYDPNAGMDSNMNVGYDSNAGMGTDPNMNAAFDSNAGMEANNPLNPAPQLNSETFNQVGYNPISSDANAFSGSNFDKTGFDTTNEKPPKKGSKIILILMLLLCIIAVGAIVTFIVLKNKANNTQTIMSTTFDTYFSEIFEGVTSTTVTNMDTYTVESDCTLSIESATYAKMLESGDENTKSLIDALKNIEVISTQKMQENQKCYVNLAVKVGDEELVGGSANVNFEDKRTFVQVNQLIDKYFEYKLDENEYDSISESMKLYGATDTQTIKEILKSEVSSLIKSEYLSKTTEEVDGVICNRHSLKMTEAQLGSELLRIIDELKDNSSFINCFDEAGQKQIDELLSKAKNIAEKLSKGSPNNFYELCIYTKGSLKQEFVSGKIISSSEGKISATIKFRGNLKDGIMYELDDYDKNGSVEKTYTGMIRVSKSGTTTDYSISVNSEEITIDLSGTTNIIDGAEIEEINDDQVMDINDLSQEDADTIRENLSNAKIYSAFYTITGQDPFKIFEESEERRDDEPEEDENRWEEPEERREEDEERREEEEEPREEERREEESVEEERREEEEEPREEENNDEFEIEQF